MAVHVFRDADVFADGQELTGQVRATSLSYGAEPLDATVLNSTTRLFVGGLKTVAMSHEGFWFANTTASTDALDSARFAEIGTSGTVVTIAAGGTEGSRSFFFESVVTDYTPRGTVGELFGYNVSAAANSGPGLVRGTVLWNSTAVSSTQVAAGASTSEALNLTDSSSKKTTYGALHILTATSSGATGLQVLVQSDNSSAFGSPTTVFTFTLSTAAGAGAGEWKSGTGSTDTWFRATNAAASSNSRYAVHLSIGFSSN